MEPGKKQDPLSTYKLPFKTKDKVKNDVKKVANNVVLDRLVYSLELIFSLQPHNKQRPTNMAELDFPHKKRGSNLKTF